MVFVRRVIDLSLPITSLATPMFPGYPQPLRTTLATVKDNGYESYLWTLVEHTATHVDAPLHMVEGTNPIHRLPIETFVCPGVIIDFSRAGLRHKITEAEVLKSLGPARGAGRAVLFRTSYKSKRGSPISGSDHPDITREAAAALVRMKVRVVGVDAPSPDHAPYEAHKTLLSAGIPIFENLTSLAKLIGKEFIFVGAPLPLVGGSGSPCRALALLLF